MPSTRSARSPERRLLAFLRRHRIPRGAHVLAAFSGGPDSRALLELLALGRGRLVVRAAYLDHGIRAETERDAELEFVRRTCARLGVALEVGSLPPGELAAAARSEGRSLEELARERRYRFLEDTADRRGCLFIAVAHTADDQVETLIMRFFQGAGPGGLAGIPSRRGRIIRPLLDCSREELESWLAERGLDYRLDSSNADPAHLRNAVRLEVLPVIRRLFPGYRRSLASLASVMRELDTLLAGEAARRLPWQRSREGFAIESERYLAAPPLLRRLSLYPLLAKLGVARARLPAGFLRSAALAGRGVRLARRGVEFQLRKDVVGPGKKGYLVAGEPNCRYSLATAGLVLDFANGPPGKGGALVVRSATTADRLGSGRKSTAVSSLYSAWRLSLTDRWRVPIVADRTGVLAVLGKALGGKDRSGEPAGTGAGGVAVTVAPGEEE